MQHTVRANAYGSVLEPMVYCAVYPKTKIHGSENQGLARAVALLTIPPSDPLEEFVHHVSATLGSEGSGLQGRGKPQTELPLALK